MGQDSLFVFSTSSDQWFSFWMCVLFGAGFGLVFAAQFTGALEKAAKFPPERSGTIVVGTLFGASLGTLYGYANYLTVANSFKCSANSKTVSLTFPTSIVTLAHDDVTYRRSLVGYRGGGAWRLAFHLKTKTYETAGVDVVALQRAMQLARSCGLREYAEPNGS